MKPDTCDITHPLAREYAETHTTPEDEVLHDITRWTHLNMAQPRMNAGPFQGKLLQMVSQMIRPSRAIEIGSYVGYSTICLARGLRPDGILHAVEVEEEYEDRIRTHLRQAGVENRVNLHIGDAAQVIPQIDEIFDLAFVDADKTHTREHYDLILPKMRSGGFILVDNILWGGKVLSNTADRDTRILKDFNEYVQNDARVENLLLPVRDGLMLCRVI